jgi:hypothetical protein
MENMDISWFESMSKNILAHYNYDPEFAHINEDKFVCGTLEKIVEAIGKVESTDDIARLKADSTAVLECIRKLREKTADIKWYA